MIKLLTNKEKNLKSTQMRGREENTHRESKDEEQFLLERFKLQDSVEDLVFQRKRDTFTLEFFAGSQWFPKEGDRHHDTTTLLSQHLEDGSRSSVHVCMASLG